MRLISALLFFSAIPLKHFAGVEQIPLQLNNVRSSEETMQYTERSPSKGSLNSKVKSDPNQKQEPLSSVKGSQPRLKNEDSSVVQTGGLSQETQLQEEEELSAPVCDSKVDPCEPDPRWYFELKPGYFYFQDSLMRQFYGSGGFTIRGETGYKMWGPFYVWLDGGYFQKEGESLGVSAVTKIKIATITLGLKTIFYLHDRFAFYAGGGPRVFMMMLHNSSPYVRGDDNEISVGVGVDAGFWIFPFPFSRNLFIDLFADYSLKKLEVEPDEISSHDFNVDISGLSFGAALGIRF
jgi:hypothetical protein